MTRLTVISHSCVLPENQKIWAEVARHPDIDLTLIAPAYWNSSLHGPVEFKALPELAERSVPVRVYWPGRLHLHTYSDLGPAMTKSVPDVLYLDEDSHSFMAAQALSIQAIMDYRLLITLKQNVLKRYPFPFGWIEKRAYRLARAAAATSQECLDVARLKGFSRPAEVIGYPIDTSLFRPRTTPTPADHLRLGFAGRLIPEKGVADLIEGVALVQKTVPAQLAVVGTGSEAATLSKLAGASLQPGSFVSWDRLPPEDMAEWYQNLDLLVLPSRTTPQWKEQFGRVMGEALACGVPVIGSSSGFIPEFLDLTGGGLTYPEGDVPALAEVILRLAAEAPLRRELAQKGREGVVREFGLPAVAEKIAQMVLAQRRRAPDSEA
ncbi:MAG: glycosyltransferase family 4 protein [Armatimonadota bacterium]